MNMFGLGFYFFETGRPQTPCFALLKLLGQNSQLHHGEFFVEFCWSLIIFYIILNSNTRLRKIDLYTCIVIIDKQEFDTFDW